MNDNIQKKLDALVTIYKEKLPEKINGIEMLWQEQQQHWNVNSFADFHREVHSLCGSAGTYGYHDISKAARSLEVFLKAIISKQVMSADDQQTISNYLQQLKTVSIQSLQVKSILQDSYHPESSDTGIIYIVEQDALLNQQLMEALTHIGYKVHLLADLNILQLAVKEKVPTAMIIDTEYLDKPGIEMISRIQIEHEASIQLFCILPNSGLLPRLEAIRAGSQAFFQKPVDVNYLAQQLDYKCGFNPNETYRILIIDDSESLAKYYSLILNQAGMDARAITNPLKLLDELETFQPDLLLMDVYMPGCTGYELAAVLRQESNYTKIPIIFLSTEEDSEKKLFAISLGGDDFLTKPISSQHLISAVKSRSNRANILNYYMITDSLTGLLNHSSILKKLDIQLNQTGKDAISGCFVMVDIDHFKRVNDSYGHQTGDQVIKKLSALLLSRTRSQDSVGRYGGEEFVLILPGASIENAEQIVNGLRVQFSQYRFNENKQIFHVSFSAGISFFENRNDPAKITEQADRALYQAKTKGRNQVVVFNQ